MKETTLRMVRIGMAFLLTAGAGMHPAAAQSSDALINKLIDKGILTVKEANELREESDKGFNQAYAVKSGLPEWVHSMRWGGDFRGRFEYFHSDNPLAIERERLQYRLRLGLVVSMLDDMEVGVRLNSIGDTPGNPISSNQTFDNNATKKGVGLDLVYGKWSPVNTADWAFSFIVGKMENPLLFQPIVFDPDYTPEGFGQQLVYHLNPRHDLKLNLGQFILEERGNRLIDSYLVAGQLLWDANWNKSWQTTLGIGALAIGGTSRLTPANGILNIGEGNTRVGNSASNAPLYGFNPIIADAAVTYTVETFPMYPGSFPIRLQGEFLHNPAAPNENNGYSLRLALGKSGKRKTWELSYEYRELQRDAIFEELPESDFNAFTQTPLTTGGISGFVNGTNVRGHIVRAGYSPYDSLTLGVTYWLTENIVKSPAGSESEAGRLQVDAIWKF